MVELSDLHGLWRRTLIAWLDDCYDIATEVYWLQGPRCFADLRIPVGRPKLEGASCLRDLDWPMLRFMALQEGFIGHLEVADGVAHWHRAFDYQPDTGASDKGRLTFQNDMLVEQGVDTPYVEHWRREPATTPGVMALWLSAGSASGFVGCLVATSDVFIYARGRAAPLPRDTTLNGLLDAAPSLDTAQALFDCEISFGRRDAEAWRIEKSSLPFREGHLLAPVVADAGKRLSVHDLTPEGTAFRRAWRVAASESTTPTTASATSPASASSTRELEGLP